MKTIFFSALLVFAIGLHANCQTNSKVKMPLPTSGSTGIPENITKTEQPKIVMPPDSIAIVSLKDYNTFFVFLQENISKSAYDKLTPDKVLIEFYNWAVLEFNKKKKK